jgi:putative heme-binding domain-containing protein
MHAAIALGKWGATGASNALFAFAARDASNPTLRTAAVIGLAGAAHTADLAARANDPSREVRLASVVTLRRRQSPAVAAFLNDRDPLVIAEAARAIHDDTSIPGAMPTLAAMLATDLRDEMTLRRAINANLRLGTPESAARLADYAMDQAAPVAMRREALESLLVWDAPPRLDRVDGYARTYQPQPIHDVLQSRLDRLLALSEPDLKTLGVKLMVTQELDATAAQMAAILADSTAPSDLRSQALRLMASRHGNDPAFARALDAALASGSPEELFRTALELLPPAQGARLVTEARTALAERDTATRQTVLRLLASRDHAAADALLKEQAALLVAGTYPEALQLDLIEALEARRAAVPAIDQALAAYATTPAAAARQELLAGGDPARGREIGLNHLGGNCLACHRIESPVGSAVGPVLRSIGRERDAAYLLESLINPGAAIAPGFGFVSLTLKDGSALGGTLAKESPDSVTVRLPDGVERTVPRGDIAALTPPISIMPSMDGILQPREIRDLVAYLQTLRGRP